MFVDFKMNPNFDATMLPVGTLLFEFALPQPNAQALADQFEKMEV